MIPQMNKPTARVIRIALLRRGLILKDLAALIPADYDRLQKIVNGYRRPHESELRAIAAALDLPVHSVASALLPALPSCRRTEKS